MRSSTTRRVAVVNTGEKAFTLRIDVSILGVTDFDPSVLVDENVTRFGVAVYYSILEKTL